MFSSKNSKPQNRIDSLVGAGTGIEGNVSFAGGLRVDGEIKGNVIGDPSKPSTLVLSEHGRIEGEIRVTHLVVNGAIVGPVTAGEYLELQGKAKVTGDVCYKSLEIQLGAVIDGKLVHSAETEDKVVAFKLGGTEA